MVTGSTLPALAARCLLSAGVTTLVIKLGCQGCAIYTADHEILSPGFEVEAKDTTGAGDCFVGSFLSALLRGASLSEAGRYANAVGALSVQKVGGATAIPDRMDVDGWIAQYCDQHRSRNTE
jgi:ribokinase